MFTKKILGILAAVLGAALIVFSFYIKQSVGEGKELFAKAQSQIQQGSNLLSLNPITKDVGEGLKQSVQDKINEGIAKANSYNTMALWFQIGGGVLIVLGVGYIFFSRKKKV